MLLFVLATSSRTCSPVPIPILLGPPSRKFTDQPAIADSAIPNVVCGRKMTSRISSPPLAVGKRHCVLVAWASRSFLGQAQGQYFQMLQKQADHGPIFSAVASRQAPKVAQGRVGPCPNLSRLAAGLGVSQQGGRSNIGGKPAPKSMSRHVLSSWNGVEALAASHIPGLA